MSSNDNIENYNQNKQPLDTSSYLESLQVNKSKPN